MAQPNWYRTCVGCGKARHKFELLRIVRSQDGHVAIDPEQNRAGRGAYLCRSEACAKLAQRRRAFHRAFKVDVPEQFYEQLIRWVVDLEHR